MKDDYCLNNADTVNKDANNGANDTRYWYQKIWENNKRK